MLNIELRDLIRSIVQDEFIEVYGLACTVSNVHEDETLGYICDCAPVNGKPIVSDVRLKAEKDGEVLVLPKDGSIVFVNMEDERTGFVSMFGQIDSIQWFDGTNGGLIKINDLVTRLKEYEALFTSLKDDFNSWVVVASDGGAALKTVLGSGFLTEEIPDTEKEDFENELILH